MTSRLKYACPCCGYKTFINQPNGTYDICTVCYWEDDLIQLLNCDESGGANRVSLRQAQINFREFGACEREMLKYVRKPSIGEERDPDWKFLD